MTPEQRSKNASNARTARERTLLREVARLGALLAAKNEQHAQAAESCNKAWDEVSKYSREAATANDELAKVRFVAAAWRDEAMHQQARLVEERALRLRDEQKELPF